MTVVGVLPGPITDPELIKVIDYRKKLHEGMDRLPEYTASEWAILLSVKLGQVSELAMRLDNTDWPAAGAPEELRGQLLQGLIEIAGGALDAAKGVERDYPL